jgi:hypothetical protein
MNIETKYNIGDTLWVMASNKPTEIAIREVRIVVNNKGLNTDIEYTDIEYFGYIYPGRLECPVKIKEKDANNSKAALRNKIFGKI